MLQKFEDVLTNELPNKQLPQHVINHRIELKSRTEPPRKAPYRLNQVELTQLKRQLTRFLAKRYIWLSKWPYGTPIFFVGKKDGKLCMCVDYCALNQAAIKNQYPLPRIDDLIDKLKDACWFLQIDLNFGYYQIIIAEHDIEKTPFRMDYGSYDFLVMPLSLCNVLATFITIRNTLFENEVNDFVVVYIDDSLVFSKTWDKYLRHLELVLLRLREHKLYANLANCEFARESINFLSHKIRD